jgi:hypothetical protein
VSRTYRSSDRNNFTFKHSPKHLSMQSCLYKRQTQIPTEPEDYLELTYRDRTRHTCLRFPYYTCSWDDIYPASFADRWSGKVKPFYCDKNTRFSTCQAKIIARSI